MSSVQFEPSTVGMHRERMSYAEWQVLPEDLRAEWVNGWAVWPMSPPTYDHGRGQAKLAVLFDVAFPDLFVATESFLQLRGNRVRLPDVALVDQEPEGGTIIDPPVLVAEVISPSTQGHDYVTKSHEYATAGIGQYWILDPRQRRLEVFELVDGEWVSLLALDDDSPGGAVTVAEHGSVEVDVRALLRRKPDVAE